MATEADTESGIEQEQHYQGLEATPDVDIEFGGLGAAVGGWRFSWRKFKRLFKHAARGAATSVAVGDAINAQYPGLGDAAQKGMQLVEAGHAGDPTALAQLKAVADGAAAGDPAKAKAHDMLTTISDARKEAAAEAEAPYVMLGKKKVYVVRDPKTGKKRKFKSKAAAEAWMAGQRQAQRAVTPEDVQEAIRQTPPEGRPQLVQSIQQAQAQGRYPARPVAAPGPQPYGYGVQPPYGYGSPRVQGQYAGVPVSQPYGPQWRSPAQYEQENYYGGDDDYELEQAFAGDEVFPDEAFVGEHPVAFKG